MVSLLKLLIFLVLCTVIAATQASKKYVLETYVVLDNLTLESYDGDEAALSQDAEFLFTYVNKLLSTMKEYGLDVQIKIVKMEIVKKDIFLEMGVKPETLNSIFARTTFVSWLGSNKAMKRTDYDCALLYTRHKILSTWIESKSVSGVATVGKICKHHEDRIPTGIVTFKDFSTAFFTAHEIGHILGSHHDPISSPYLMNTTLNVDNAKRFIFSRFTAGNISRDLSENGEQCLVQTSTSSWRPDISVDQYKGELRNASAICQRLFKDKHNVYPVLTKPQENSLMDGDPKERICLFFYCSYGVSKKFTRVFSPDGMACDENKICQTGECLDDTSGYAKNILPGCPFGDEKLVEYKGRVLTCRSAIALGNFCKSADKDKCCASCYKEENKGKNKKSKSKKSWNKG